jgi:hypothetical protein
MRWISIGIFRSTPFDPSSGVQLSRESMTSAMDRFERGPDLRVEDWMLAVP